MQSAQCLRINIVLKSLSLLSRRQGPLRATFAVTAQHFSMASSSAQPEGTKLRYIDVGPQEVFLDIYNATYRCIDWYQPR
jgi:hypothetical protein